MTSNQTHTVPVNIDGITVRVEATCPSWTTTNDSEIESDVSGKILSFEEVNKTISAISKELSKSLAIAKPTKATVEFGIELQQESGKLLAQIIQGSGKVNLKITLEWSNTER
ncbi:CU044_2847 family protein [Microcoleus sp. N9_B2]|uniref:CU044_2847 family protein n=1 Tax=unclassified Microcoleus TaxID=2642155 RepID=UPI002FD72769